MGPFTQKGSHRDQHHRHTLLSESLFCCVCKYHASFSDGGLRRKLKNKSIEINNVCEDLLGTLSPDTISIREAYTSDTSRNRKRTPRVLFSPDERLRTGKTRKMTQQNIQLNSNEVGECPNSITETDLKKNALKKEIGTDLISKLLKMTIHEQRSILASFCEDYSKNTIESVLGIKVSPQEWNKIRIHRRYPGPYKPVIKSKIYRQKVSTTHLQRLLTFLQTPGYLQRVAFGTKVEQVLDGNDFERLDNISRVVRLSKITADFLIAMDQEAIYEGSLPSSEVRCQHLERGTFRRCLLQRNHKLDGYSNQCKFTEKGSVATRTIEEFIKTLTSGQIKALSGLDDIKEIKGRKSFQSLRLLSKSMAWNIIQ